MSNPHVLILPSWYPTGYFPMRGTFFREQAQALKEAGCQVGVIYPDFRSLRSINRGKLLTTRFQRAYRIEDGIPTYRVCGWNVISARLRGRLWVNLVKSMWRAYVAQWGRPDILHAHSVLWGGVAARQLSMQTGLPYVITEHSSGFARSMIRVWQEPFIEDAFTHASATIAVSGALARALSSYLPKGGSDIEIIPNMVDVSYFSLSPVRASDGPFRFLTVAFLKKNKGIDTLLRAFTQAFRERDDVGLEIGGDGPERRALERLVQELGIHDRVKFLGYLHREEVKTAMWRAHAFVLPSYVETFGVVLIEAMATGLPVIATYSGGPEEIVTPQTGILVKPGNVSALARALWHVKENREAFPAETIRTNVVQKYSKTAVVTRLLALYQNILTHQDQ